MGVPKRHQRGEVKVTVVYVCLFSLLLRITDLEVFQGGRFGRLRARLHPYGRLPSARKSGTGERNIEFRVQKMQLTTAGSSDAGWRQQRGRVQRLQELDWLRGRLSRLIEM